MMDQAKVKIKIKKNLNHLRMIGYLCVNGASKG